MQFKRLFTQSSSDPYALINFRQPEPVGDGFDVLLEHPDGWSVASVEVLAEQAACSNVHVQKKVIEENTVPSWLWKQSRAKAVGKKETSVRDIFNRVVGAAAYRGWKQGFFKNEDEARIFFDEARYALAQRMIAIEPKHLANFGLEWAYGIETSEPQEKPAKTPAIDISNAMIDAVVSGRRDRVLASKWNKVINARTKTAPVALRFSDTEAQWETPAANTAGVWLNLVCFRHNDGSVNIEALRQAVRLAVVLADLNDAAARYALAIGYANLAPLLLALALPYDSEAGRATAAAITAIITAEAYAMSAELAEARGASSDFVANRETCLRALRNHRRAAYGEQNDYEKISVTPLPLALALCPDLALTAAARSAWDHALDLAQKHGLRHTQVTSLFASPELTLLMESEADGIAPLRSLAVREAEDGNRRALHPSAIEALARLGYDQRKIQAVARHIAGALTLEKAPAINHVSLRARGFTANALEKVETYLPQAKNLRYVFTPWVLGAEFCRNTLKIPAAQLEDMRFNILAHLGFSEADISAANLWCYGHEGIEGAALLNPQHAAVFATALSLPPEAPIRMAAAVQGFVSGETALDLHLPLGTSAERFEKFVLDAWRRGVKSVNVAFDADPGADAVKAAQPATVRRKTGPKMAVSAFVHAKVPALPKRHSRAAAPRLGGMSHSKAKSRGLSKSH